METGRVRALAAGGRVGVGGWAHPVGAGAVVFTAPGVVAGQGRVAPVVGGGVVGSAAAQPGILEAFEHGQRGIYRRDAGRAERRRTRQGRVGARAAVLNNIELVSRAGREARDGVGRAGKARDGGVGVGARAGQGRVEARGAVKHRVGARAAGQPAHCGRRGRGRRGGQVSWGEAASGRLQYDVIQANVRRAEVGAGTEANNGRGRRTAEGQHLRRERGTCVVARQAAEGHAAIGRELHYQRVRARSVDKVKAQALGSGGAQVHKQVERAKQARAAVAAMKAGRVCAQAGIGRVQVAVGQRPGGAGAVVFAPPRVIARHGRVAPAGGRNIVRGAAVEPGILEAFQHRQRGIYRGQALRGEREGPCHLAGGADPTALRHVELVTGVGRQARYGHRQVGRIHGGAARAARREAADAVLHHVVGGRAAARAIRERRRCRADVGSRQGGGWSTGRGRANRHHKVLGFAAAEGRAGISPGVGAAVAAAAHPQAGLAQGSVGGHGYVHGHGRVGRGSGRNLRPLGGFKRAVLVVVNPHRNNAVAVAIHRHGVAEALEQGARGSAGGRVAGVGAGGRAHAVGHGAAGKGGSVQARAAHGNLGQVVRAAYAAQVGSTGVAVRRYRVGGEALHAAAYGGAVGVAGHYLVVVSGSGRERADGRVGGAGLVGAHQQRGGRGAKIHVVAGGNARAGLPAKRGIARHVGGRCGRYQVGSAGGHARQHCQAHIVQANIGGEGGRDLGAETDHRCGRGSSQAHALGLPALGHCAAHAQAQQGCPEGAATIRRHLHLQGVVAGGVEVIELQHLVAAGAQVHI